MYTSFLTALLELVLDNFFVCVGLTLVILLIYMPGNKMAFGKKKRKKKEMVLEKTEDQSQK